MTNADFVKYCYERILGRRPDSDGGEWWEAALDRREVTREAMLLELLKSEELSAAFDHREFVPPGHYYSAIPSLADRERFLLESHTRDSIPGVDLNEDAQFALLESFHHLYQDCPFPEDPSDGFRYYFGNDFYAHTDGLALYFILRTFEPKRIIEVGSGFSSALMLDTSEHAFNSGMELTFIDPHPERLQSLLREGDAGSRILRACVQDVPLETFEILEDGDVLFIDSSHVSKLGSDVNYLVHEVLPVLKDGVLVHFHDVNWPFEYPSEWVAGRRFWNEAYILRAFLQYNATFEVIFFSDFLKDRHESWLQEHMPRFMLNGGGNLWLRKRCPPSRSAGA